MAPKIYVVRVSRRFWIARSSTSPRVNPEHVQPRESAPHSQRTIDNSETDGRVADIADGESTVEWTGGSAEAG